MRKGAGINSFCSKTISPKSVITLMTWDELRNGVYEIDGSWRDIYVLGTTREDWLKWANYANNNFSLTWRDAESEEDNVSNKIDLERIIRHFDSHMFVSSVRVFVSGITVNAHFFTENEIENDIDPSQIRSLEDHNNLMSYMRSVSSLLNKEVILTSENCSDYVLIKANGEHVEFVR
jgi:hypothetical protein